MGTRCGSSFTIRAGRLGCMTDLPENDMSEITNAQTTTLAPHSNSIPTPSRARWLPRRAHVLRGQRGLNRGLVLSWRFTNPFTVLADGIVPFFIDWGQIPHPARSAAQGITLVDLRAEHPDFKRVQGVLNHSDSIFQ